MVKVVTNGQGKVYTSSGKALIASSGGAYQLHRVKDDSNNEIGTAFMEFEDANGNKYDVVCLDAQYRLASAQWCSNSGKVTNLPYYNDNVTAFWYYAKETAAFNTQKILDYCTTNNYTSTSCTHCRSKSFVINGTRYYGQLPNMREVFDLWINRADIESKDTTASSYSSLNFSTKRGIWSSTQMSSSSSRFLTINGSVSEGNKSNSLFACPVLEIPK